MTELNNNGASVETRETIVTEETKPGFLKRFLSKRPVQVVLGVGALGGAAAGVAWKIKTGASAEEIADAGVKVAAAFTRLVA